MRAVKKSLIQADPKKIQAARLSHESAPGKPLTQAKLVEMLHEVGVKISERRLQTIEATGRVKQSVLATICELLDVDLDSMLPDGQLPWSIPRAEWNPLIHSPAWLLRAEMAVVPFHFRREERAALEDWCLDANPLRARLIWGQGGMGKTRLALELCKWMRDRGWRAGFINYDLFSSDQNLWVEAMKDPDPILVVLDYAESRIAKIDWLIGMVASLRPNRFRILLLARSKSGDWWAELCRCRNAGALVASKAMDVQQLMPFTMDSKKRKESYQLAAKGFAERLGRPEPIVSPHHIDSAVYDRILLLHIQALASIDKIHGENEDGILDYLLHRERRFWSERISSRQMDSSLLIAVEEAMTAVTANGGVKSMEEGLALLRLLPSLDGRPQDIRVALNNLLHECYPGSNWIEPVQPDIFGERLSEVVLGNNRPLRRALIGETAKAARKRKGND